MLTIFTLEHSQLVSYASKFHRIVMFLLRHSNDSSNRYVKREIRTLTDADREAVFDAMATVWQYSQEEGKATFGDKFTSIDTYVTIHSEASNDVMCDQYHEGSGFLTHHLAMAVSFEAAIRAVNPAVTLPYWDFTIEGMRPLRLVSGLPALISLDLSRRNNRKSRPSSIFLTANIRDVHR